MLFPLSLILLSSCFSTRKTERQPSIPVVDPIKLQIDTLTYVVKAAVSPDSSVLKNEARDSLTSANPAIDTIPFPDTLYFPDSLQQVETFPDTTAFFEISEIDTICIIGTGDIMPGTNYPDDRYLPPGNNCSLLFDPVDEILRSGDVTFGNLEGVFCSSGGIAKKCKDPSVCYVFRMPDSYLECILDAGYNLLSVANNHVNDFGYEGRLSTASLLEEAGVAFAGFQSKPYAIFEKEGISYGFAAFAPHLGTMNLKDYDDAARIVSGLDSLCDIVIVSFHGGAEGKDYQHVPCTDEEYLGYNRGNVCRFAHTVVDAGADVVFGHGPHVTRAMELYKGRLVAYSLGNFCTYARFNLSGPNGIAPIVKVYTDRKGQFLEGKIIPVYQPGEGGPRIDSLNRAVNMLRELSKADFPHSMLEIDENGNMFVR